MANQNFNDVFEDISHLIEQFNEVKKDVDKLTNNAYDFTNLAIIFNNKFIEILHIFQDKNVDFNNSYLKSLIYRYFCVLVYESFRVIDKFSTAYTHSLKIFDNSLITFPLSKKCMKYVDEFLCIEEKMINFDIFEDIEDAYTTDVYADKKYKIDTSEKFYSYYGNYAALKYNDELKRLGCKDMLCPIDIVENKAVSICDDLVPDDNLILISKACDLNSMIDETYKAFPMILLSLKYLLFDYINKANVEFLRGHLDIYKVYKEKIINFNASKEIINSIGRYISYYIKDDYKQNKRWSNFKNELKSLGLHDLITTIENNVDSGIYREYVSRKEELLSERDNAFMSSTETLFNFFVLEDQELLSEYSYKMRWANE